MNILHFCPPHLSDVATLPWEIQKSFSAVLFIHSSDDSRLRKKTNYYLHRLLLHVGHTTGGARVSSTSP